MHGINRVDRAATTWSRSIATALIVAIARKRRGLRTKGAAGSAQAVGKAAGLPLYRLFGGYRSEVPCYVTCAYYRDGKSMAELRDEIEMLKAQGISVPVFGCGGGAVKRDFVESYDMGVYGVKAFHAPKLAEAALAGKSFKDIRKEYPKVVGEFVAEYADRM